MSIFHKILDLIGTKDSDTQLTIVALALFLTIVTGWTVSCVTDAVPASIAIYRGHTLLKVSNTRTHVISKDMAAMLDKTILAEMLK